MPQILSVALKRILPPLIVFGVLVVVWSLVVWGFGIRPFLLPSPLAVYQSASEYAGELMRAFALTGAAAVCGFAASMTAGVLIAFAFSQSAWIRSSCYPYAIFLQTVPMIAIAPMINTWFGNGFHSVVIVSMIISLFPVITSTTKGLLSIDKSSIELFELYNAGRIQTLTKLRLPNAIPDVIAGAKTSSGLAVIGAIVGEFFSGYESQLGLGYLILLTSDQLKTDKLFASVLTSTMLGVLIFAVVTAVGNAIQKRWFSHLEMAS